MEVAPLTLAHTHARNAVLETRKSNPVAASEEHDLAAGEFATAAQSTSNQEALRTLQLLEQHHKKLADILRFQHEHPASTTEAPSAAPSANTIGQPAAPDVRVGKTGNQDAQSQPPKLPGNPRMSRESSSIASNLASARGIPAHPRRGSPVSPTLSTQQAGSKMTDRSRMAEPRTRDVLTKNQNSRTPRQPWSPPLPSPTDITSQQVVPSRGAEVIPSKDRSTTTEDSFQRFYSTFEGLISKISAPLAFAGLPLGTDDSPKAVPTSQKSPAETKLDRHPATSDRNSTFKEPDVDRLFSRAALRSIHDMPGTGPGPGNPAESFYVVPTTGGTMSYAGIITRTEREARRNSFEDAEDDFVDARETPASPELRQTLGNSSRVARRGASDKLTALQNVKTLEELQMENQALKQLSDTLSKRLHMWEVNAQSSSMALQQSLRAMHHHNGTSDFYQQGSTAAISPAATLARALPTSDADTRVKELEDLVRRGEQELERVARENDKLNKVLGRYRERWEKLKEGAKSRRAEGRSGDGQSNPTTPVVGVGGSKHDIPPSPRPERKASSSGASRRGSEADTERVESAGT